MRQRDLRTGVVYMLRGDGAPVPAVIVDTEHRYETVPHYRRRADGTSAHTYTVGEGEKFLTVILKAVHAKRLRADKVEEMKELLLAEAARCPLPEPGEHQGEFFTETPRTQNPIFLATLLSAREFEARYDDAAEVRLNRVRYDTEVLNGQRNERQRIKDMLERLGELTGTPDLRWSVVEQDNTSVSLTVKNLESVLARVEALRATGPLSDGAL